MVLQVSLVPVVPSVPVISQIPQVPLVPVVHLIAVGSSGVHFPFRRKRHHMKCAHQCQGIQIIAIVNEEIS